MFAVFSFPVSQDTAINIVRFAQAVEKEAPLLLACVRDISSVDLHRVEASLHKLIRSWNMCVPLNIYYLNRGLLFMPQIRAKTWFEYLLDRKAEIIFGGFPLNHPARQFLLETFWSAYQHEEPEHRVYTDHSSRLGRCFPYYIFADEGRGLRKAPVQVVALETVLNVTTYKKFLSKMRGRPENSWRGDQQLFLEASDHTGHGSSFCSRLLLYILPHGVYKGKSKNNWFLPINFLEQEPVPAKYVFWHCCCKAC